MIPLLLTILLAVLSTLVLGGKLPVRDGVVSGVQANPNIHEKVPEIAIDDVVFNPGHLRYVEDSGVCETTPGVYTASGYADLTSTKHMWFWFFAARNNPDEAPLTIWLNGGPGTSSMLSLFQEHGPCLLNNDSSSIRLNPQSWNQASNMLYVDQPIGVGFSYGDNPAGLTGEAGVDMWDFLQIFFADAKFSKYKARDLGLWTQGYGGHYGPGMVLYFLTQSKAIAAGKLSGTPINIRVLGIGNGFTDPTTEYPGFISYAKTNPHHQLVSDSTIEMANTSYYSEGGCGKMIQNCLIYARDIDCGGAKLTCDKNIVVPLYGQWDPRYILDIYPSAYPPNVTTWLNNQTVMIGAEKTWSEFSETVFDSFVATGDVMKTTLQLLEKVIDSGIRTVIYAGDAYYFSNYQNVENMVNSMTHKDSWKYASTPWTPWTVDGVTVGQYKNVGNFSHVQISGAGEMVSAYTVGNLPYGKHTLTMYNQAMAGKPISST